MTEEQIEQKAGEGFNKVGYDKNGWPTGYNKVSYIKGFIDGYHEGFKDCAKARLNVTTISDCPIKDGWHKMDYNDKESFKNIPRYTELLTKYSCGLFEAHCINKWTGDHWCEHSYGVIAWCEIPTFDKE